MSELRIFKHPPREIDPGLPWLGAEYMIPDPDPAVEGDIDWQGVMIPVSVDPVDQSILLHLADDTTLGIHLGDLLELVGRELVRQAP